MVDQRVAIVGGGVLGLFTALELAREGGVKVQVFEAAHPGSGSSGRSVGMVETQYLEKPDIEVRLFGREVYTALEQDHGLPFVHSGYLRLGRSEEDISQFERSLRFQSELGIDDATMLSRKELSARWPQLISDDLIVGLFGQWDGYVDGFEVCQLLARLVREAGGEVLLRARLLTAEQDADKSWRLETTVGMFEADVVVNAAGPWAAAVGEILGAPIAFNPQLHSVLSINLIDALPFTPFVMDYVPGSGKDGVYFRSENSHQLLAGLHTDEAIHAAVSPDVKLGPVQPEVTDRIAALLRDRLRDVDDMRVGNGWTGIYPMSPDNFPIVGRHTTVPEVVCAVGAGGSGIQLSPAIGKLAADAVLMRTAPVFGSGVNWSPGR